MKMLFLSAFAICLFSFTSCRNSLPPEETVDRIDRLPIIYPDYREVTIPRNIAPLNFRIKEKGNYFGIVVHPQKGRELYVFSKSPFVQFRFANWRRALNRSAGDTLIVTVFCRRDGKWVKFRSFPIYVAEEPVDEYMVYRLIHPAHLLWREMGIHQRRLSDFTEKTILHNRTIGGQCMNCHHFCGNDPSAFMLHLRGGQTAGTLLLRNGRLRKINTATSFNRAGAYPAWSPDGKRIAFSVNQLEMFFHADEEPRDVLDRGSDIVIYDIDRNLISTVPDLAAPDRMETFPAWSSNGGALYFCSSPAFETFIDQDGLHYEQVRYDLMRISFDEQKGWGRAEVVLSAKETGRSITEPAASPDGKYLLFCMADNGHFPIYRRDSDIYLLDLSSGHYEKLSINSEQNDTFPSWSSNGRWLLFSSKRRDLVFSHPYICYVSKSGKTAKAFILPQKSPDFYDRFNLTYNRPVFIKGSIVVSQQRLVKTAYDNHNKIDAVLDSRLESGGAEKKTPEYHPAPN